MAGVKGRSGGGNRVPADTHILRGTFRPSRHRGSAAPAIAPEAEQDWQPTTKEWKGLGPAGRAFITALRNEFALGFLEGATALEAARAADQLAALRDGDPTDAPARADAARDRRLRQWSTFFAAQVRELRLAVSKL